MGEDQHDGTTISEFGHRRQCRPQPRVVADRPVGHGHVQVFPDQHTLARNIAHIVKRTVGFHAHFSN